MADPTPGADEGTQADSRYWVKEKVLAQSELRQRILSARYRPGRKLIRDEIAAELGISDLALREALVALESEGLIENLARRGAYVAGLSAEDIGDHFAIYGTISALAARRAATVRTEDDLVELTALCDEKGRDAHGRPISRRCYFFHRAVNRIGAGRRLQAELRRLGAGVPGIVGEVSSDWSDVSDADHLAILNSLVSGDPVVAFDRTYDHVRSIGQFAVARIASEGAKMPTKNTLGEPVASWAALDIVETA